MTNKALSGVKVVELGEFVAAPFCAKLLADLGADVIKVEDPQGGDISRSMGPFPDDLPHPERSGLHLYLNTSKRSITLNVHTIDGQAIFKRLISDADVLVESNAPGEMDALGIGYETLRKCNPGLIMTSITPFGQTGPHRNYKAYYLNTFHAGGEGFLLPGGLGWLLYEDRPPLKAGGFLGEYDSGVAAGVATLAALLWKGAGNEGQQIDISQQEALVTLSRVEMTSYPNRGKVESRGSRSWPIAGLVQCKDGFVQIMPLVEDMWTRLAEVVGGREMAEDRRFETPTGRREHAEEINSRIDQWALQHTKNEIYDLLQAAGCPTGIVSTAEDLLKSEQLAARGYFQELDHPELGRLKYPTVPYKLSATPIQLERAAPRLGEHNEEIYCDRLGYSRHELTRMRGMGLI
ncbi:MAG: CoA transferase [Dehalococcoidia bacterium]|nr:CoA transferase [Dehalococcoidia bacterium]